MKLKKGMWYTFCCELDLTLLETDEMVADYQASWDDAVDMGEFPGYAWDTREEALDALGHE